MWLLDELETLKESDKIAIIHRDKSVTFKEFWSKSDQVANFIIENCKTNAPIVIYGNKNIDINVVMVASLKTGRAYVPIDITFPEERLLKVASIVNAEIIFNLSSSHICSNEYRIINEDHLNKSVYNSSMGFISKDLWVKKEDICYILFTSGSTGLPKGVQITRKNIENFVSWFKDSCEIPESSKVVLNQVSYSFDVSVIPLYIYLPIGKTLFNIDKEMLDDFKSLFKYLEESDISVWVSTPSFLEICSSHKDFNSNMLHKLKKFILAGEVLTKKLVNNIYEKFENSIVINGYGPTEGTVLLSACEITKDMLNNEKSLPIGIILPEASYSIVGNDNKPVNYGELGELVVISNSISNGYYKNKEQTNKVFFNAQDGRNGYRTGDLVFEENGFIYYNSRKDFQIKLNGFRIELDDISNNLNKISFIRNSLVMPIYKEERVSYIVAFVVLNTKLDIQDIKLGIKIKNELKNLVPSYMIPRKIKIVDEFPLNTNGKIDRKKLMEEI